MSDDRHDTTRPAARPEGPTAPGVRFAPPAAAGELGRFGKYRVQRLLGKGGMGEVYLAFDEWLRRPVALKLLIPDQRDAAGAAERFLREARAAARITSDHVVTVFEAAEINGAPYIAMPLLRGYPLDQFLKRKGEPDLWQTVRLAREVALGLAAAHELGVVHRDIKPGNIWLEAPHGRAKVVDFGLAKPTAGGSGSLAELTAPGLVLGTPAYMSPEQAHGARVDHRTDLFSLGAVLYRLLVGKAPFDRGSTLGTLAAIVGEEPTPVRTLNPSVPAALADLVSRLMAKTAADRPARAAAVADELAAIERALPAAGSAPVAPLSVSGEAVNPFAFDDTEAAPAPPDPTEREYASTARPRPGLVWAAVAVTAAVAVAAVAAVYALSWARGPRDEAKHDEPKPVPAPARPDPPRKNVSAEQTYNELTAAGVRQQLAATPPTRDRKLVFGTPADQAVLYRTADGGVGKMLAARDGETVSVKFETHTADGTPVSGTFKLTPYQALDLDTGDVGPSKSGSDLWWVIPMTGLPFVDFRQSGAAAVSYPFAAVPEVLYQPRNPFGLKDIFEPDQPAAVQLGNEARLPLDDTVPNANWKFKGAYQRKAGIDGEWASRWRYDAGKKKMAGWSVGTATITTVGDRVFVNYYDGSRFLIEWRREGNKLVGINQQVDGLPYGVAITAFVVGDDRIDGMWGDGGYGRWDFRR